MRRQGEQGTALLAALLVAALAGPLAPAAASEATAMISRTLTEADRGRLIALAAGDHVAVRLRENPSTGYRWQMAAPTLPVLAGEGDRFEAEHSAASKPGEGGYRVFAFKAVDTGLATLRFRLRRPWEAESAAIEELTVTVRVMAAGPSR